MKKIKTLRLAAIALSILALLSFTNVNVYASDASKVNDKASLLSDSEKSSLEKAASSVSKKTGVDVVILTANDVPSGESEKYADDFYDNGGYSADGVLLLVDMSNRDLHITTTGYGVTAFTDAGQSYILDKIQPSLSSGDYNKAFTDFIDLSGQFVDQARTGKPFDTGNLPKGKLPAAKDFLIALIAGFGFSFLKTGKMKADTENVVHEATRASYYLTEEGLKLSASEDTLTRTEVKKDSSSGGGSTTHTSSSGQTHGGSDKKF